MQHGIYFEFDFSFQKFWPHGKLDSIYYWDEKISENKAFSIQIEAPWTRYSDSFTVFCLGFNWYNKTDHAGPKLSIGFFGFEILLNLYDVRHWYNEEGRWFKPGEEAEIYGTKQ